MKGEAVAVEIALVAPAAPAAGPANPLRTKYNADLPKCIASCLPIVKKGCCCCTLRTCCLVQGWLSLVVGIMSITRLGVVMGLPKVPARAFYDIYVDNPLQFGSNRWISTCFVVLLIIAVVAIVISIIFIDGIWKRKPSRMVHFIRLHCATILLDVTCTIVLVVIDRTATSEFISYGIIRCGLSVYFLICAHSLYVEMVQELEKQDAGGVAHQHPPGHPGQPAQPPSTKYMVPVMGLAADPPPLYRRFTMGLR